MGLSLRGDLSSGRTTLAMRLVAEAQAAQAAAAPLSANELAIEKYNEGVDLMNAGNRSGAEAKFLQTVLAASVERTSHIVDGCNACEYAITFRTEV